MDATECSKMVTQRGGQCGAATRKCANPAAHTDAQGRGWCARHKPVSHIDETAQMIVENLRKKIGGGWDFLGMPLREALGEAEVLNLFCGRSYEGSPRSAADLVEDMNVYRRAVGRIINPEEWT